MAKLAITRQAPTDWFFPRVSLAQIVSGVRMPCATYQADNDNDGFVPRKLIVVPGERDQLVGCARRGTPVHARHSTSQQYSRYDPLPPRAGPSRPKNEEEREGDDTGSHRDQSRSYDVGNIVNTHVVIDGGVAQVMHAANGGTSECAPDGNTPPRDLVVGTDGHEGGDQDKNRHKEREGRETTGISNLKRCLPARHLDSSIPDEMHAPNSDATHCDGRTDEQQAFRRHKVSTGPVTDREVAKQRTD